MTSGGTGYAGVLFDFSGTLFRLEPDPAWFAGLADAEGRILDDAAQRELLHRMTVPVGPPVPMEGEALRTWHARDLSSADHRDAYLHILQHSGIGDEAEREWLYGEFSNPLNWTIYPDTDGEPWQLVLDHAPVLLESTRASASEVEDVVSGFVRRGFDVTASVPMRVAVVAIDPDGVDDPVVCASTQPGAARAVVASKAVRMDVLRSLMIGFLLQFAAC